MLERQTGKQTKKKKKKNMTDEACWQILLFFSLRRDVDNVLSVSVVI
jgi:hypothetical protein